jgi:hypothetical protein
MRAVQQFFRFFSESPERPCIQFLLAPYRHQSSRRHGHLLNLTIDNQSTSLSGEVCQLIPSQFIRTHRIG